MIKFKPDITIKERNRQKLNWKGIKLVLKR